MVIDSQTLVLEGSYGGVWGRTNPNRFWFGTCRAVNGASGATRSPQLLGDVGMFHRQSQGIPAFFTTTIYDHLHLQYSGRDWENLLQHIPNSTSGDERVRTLLTRWHPNPLDAGCGENGWGLLSGSSDQPARVNTHVGH